MRGNLKMIQLTGWICLACFFSTIASDITAGTEFKAILETSSTTNDNAEDSGKISEVTSFSSTESVTTSADTSILTDALKKDLTEHSSITEEISTLDKPVSISIARNVPEPDYMGEMTITYQNTTPNLKESSDETEKENLTAATLDKNLYYVSQTTTDNALSHDVNAELPHISIEDVISKSTPSIGLTSTKESTKYLINTTLSENMAKEYIKENHEISSTTEVEKKSVLEENSENDKLPEIISLSEDTTMDEKTLEKSISVFDNKKQNFSGMETTTTVYPEISNSKHQETILELVKDLEHSGNINGYINLEDVSVNSESDTDKILSFSDRISARINDYNVDTISVESTETNINSTRNPKRIQEEERVYPEGRLRPSHPDPGYANRPEIDLVRPYRPDAPIHQYPYYRPTPDYRTPIIREDSDYTRPSKPESDYQRVTFRPNYGHSKTSQDESSSLKPVSQFATSSKPYRPSYNRPSYPQGSFGRPYRPDYHRPSSKPADEYSVTKISEIKGGSPQDEVSEQSRADYEYTRQSESVSSFTKTYQSDSRPSPIKTDSGKPYRPTYDSDVSMHFKSTSPVDSVYDSSKVSKPDMDSNRPSSLYPRPGFGNNYLNSDTSLKPFSVGTVTSAKNLTRVEFIKADCFDNHMKVTMRFNGTFSGLVYSSGYAQDSSCSYVNGSGRNHYEFYIRLNRCGTLGQQEVAEQRLRSASRRRQERAQYLVNTVTVQYNPVIEEDIDEHFRVTCEYGYDFWKTVTFPVISVESSAVKIRTGSPVVFTLPPPQCNMEIRNGFGPAGTRVAGPVNVGDPLTLVIHMKSESTGFDILVSNCYAHNGAQKRLQLIDSNGCVVQDKLVSPFRGVSSPDRSQQVTLYSYLKAFRFTGSPALYIECDVHMCHGSCPPQRCYWRHLYKRSVNEMTTEATTTADNLISESVSLFQALEVRHEEVDSPNLLALRNQSGYDTDDVVCLRTGSFATLLACLLLLLLLTTSAAVCMCHRMRKIKRFMEPSDTKNFVEFDAHVPMK